MNYATLLDPVHPEDRSRIDTVVKHAIETAEPFAFEHRVVRADGATRVISAHGRARIDENGRTIRMMGIAHDITDRKQAEEERIQLLREQAARREAEESNRTKDHFLATLSHELRTPLNAILGWAEILRSPRTDEELRNRAIDAISRNVSIQAQLVSDILDVARIRAGTLYLQPRPMVLTEVINEALEIVHPMLAAKNIDVRVSVAPGANSLVADAQRLRQVFWNLLSNAAKFAPEGGHVVVRATPTDDGITIAVEDDGPGIDPAFPAARVRTVQPGRRVRDPSVPAAWASDWRSPITSSGCTTAISTPGIVPKAAPSSPSVCPSTPTLLEMGGLDNPRPWHYCQGVIRCGANLTCVCCCPEAQGLSRPGLASAATK